MPISINTYSRRNFIKTLSLGVVGLFLGGGIRNFKRRSSSYYILISDTHIHKSEEHTRFGINLADNFKEVVDKIINKAEYPEGVIINGDIARRQGEPGDYRTFRRLIGPLLEQDIQVYLTMGNHDDRVAFYDTLSEFSSEYYTVTDRHVMTINTPNAYLVLLDSLDNVDETPGKLGRRQLIWLDNQLKFLNDKPVILFCHHYPEKGNGKGLLDYEHLREIMDKHQQVKTLVFGHSHRWELSTEQSFYHLNIPSTAYTFQDEQPLGFVHANFGTDGLSIQLECLDDNHPWHEEHGILYYENPNFESNGKNEEFVQIRNVYPNPFNASTTIKFQLLDMDYVTVDLFTIHGRFVKSIMNNKHLLPREYEVKINADSLATGTYLVRVATSNQIKTHKIVLIK